MNALNLIFDPIDEMNLELDSSNQIEKNEDTVYTISKK